MNNKDKNFIVNFFSSNYHIYIFYNYKIYNSVAFGHFKIISSNPKNIKNKIYNKIIIIFYHLIFWTSSVWFKIE